MKLMSGSDPRDEVDALRRRLKGDGREPSQVPFKADRQHLVQLIDNMRLVQAEVGDYRQLKILRHCRRMAMLTPWPTVDDFQRNDECEEANVENEDDVEQLLEMNGLLGLSLHYRAASEAIVRWINTEYENEHTNQDYRTALRSFGRYRLKRDQPPESLSWIPTTTSNNFNPMPSERDLLLWEEDVLPMIEAARNPRDKALFALQFEAGCRSGELYDLRVRDIFDSEHSVGIHVDGKRGERTIHLIMSVPYLQRWLTEHPGSEDSYFWSKLSSPERPSYTTWNNYFKDAAERAGVTKDVTPTNFRKSNTRWLVNLGMSQPRIEDRQGRKRGSEHTQRYLARFGKESNEREYARLHGKKVKTEEPEEHGPIECPRCGQKTPPEGSRCMNCGFALSLEAAQEADQKQRAALEALPELLNGKNVDPEEAADTLDQLISRQVQAALEEHHS